MIPTPEARVPVIRRQALPVMTTFIASLNRQIANTDDEREWNSHTIETLHTILRALGAGNVELAISILSGDVVVGLLRTYRRKE